MSKKSKSQIDFKVFVDENSPDDSKDIEEQWQRAQKQQRNKQLTKVLIAGAVGIGLIFAILLNTLSRTPSHVLLDDSHPKYAYYQTLFPHIKVQVSKGSDSYEAKMVRGVGAVFAEAVSWLQGNVVPSSRVLLVPDESSGVNMLGMAVGYYLQSQINGKLDILINMNEYRVLTETNLQLMKKEYPERMPVTIINSTTQMHPKYELIILENSAFVLPESVTAPSILTILKGKGEQISEQRFQGYSKFKINKGVISEDINKIGKWYGYSLSKTIDGSSSYQPVLLVKNTEGINSCTEPHEGFVKSPHLRNLVEYLRNKTVENLYFGIQSQLTQTIIESFPQIPKNQITKFSKANSLEQVVTKVKVSGYNYFVVDYQQARKLDKKPRGTLVTLLTNQQEQNQMMSQFTSSKPMILTGYNSQGCFYPPRLLAASFSSSTPFFFVIGDQLPTNDEN